MGGWLGAARSLFSSTPTTSVSLSLRVRIALETALYSLSPSFATAWENVSYRPTPGVPYQQAYLLFAKPDNPIFSSGHRELGFMLVRLIYPLSTGLFDAMTRAELLRSAFYKGASFTSGDAIVYVERTPEILSGRVEGSRYVIPVKIRFFANDLG